MIARRCDVCGALYEQYGTRNNVLDCNSLALRNTDENNRHYEHERIDFCKECQKVIYSALHMQIKKKKGCE